MQKIRLLFVGKVLVAMALLVFAGACAVNPVTGKKEVMFLSESQEVAMGAQSDPSIVASFGVYDNATMQQFINEKGQKMASTSHRPTLKYEFKILDSPVINAFALPGGYVYFTRGIMAHFNNEAQFAGVLGHEIGHITAKHSARQYTGQILAQAGLIFGMVVSKDFAQFADVASQGLGLLFLKFGRDHESESDRLGVEYSTKIGYDAHHMADFFQTLNRVSEKAGQRIPTFLSTHPDPLDRFATVNKNADKWQNDLATTNLQVNRDQYLRMIDGLVYGEDPRQGYVENDRFYHPELKFQYPTPRGWQVANSPAQVQMAPSDGKALMIFTLSPEKSLQEAANATVEQYKLQVLKSENTTVNGMPAMAFLADMADQQQTQQQQQPNTTVNTIKVLTYLIQYNGLIYKFHGVAKSADYVAYEMTFLQTMKGFNSLSDPAKINVKPDVVRIKTAESTAPLSDQLKRWGMKQEKLEELAILNGMELNTTVNSGTLFKIVEKRQ